MSGRPRRACHQCNAQKLRCIGAKPACERCKRLNRACSWSDTSVARTHHSHTHARRISLPHFSSPSLPPTVSDSSYIGIPSALVLKLIDTFCSCLYSSSLLVHRTSLTADFTAKRAQPHLILSICALASSFYQTADKANAFRDNGFSREWAEQAARLLFGEAERADEAKVVSFTNLCLFWYGHGDWKRALVHEGNALIHLRLTSLSSTKSPTSSGTLSTELSNRRFWAAYVINQYVSEPTASFSDATIAKVWLPCREDQFEANALSPSTPATLRDDVRTSSIFAEVVRITVLWSSVYKLIRETTQDPAAKLTAVNQLDARLRQWRAGLPGCFASVLDNSTTAVDDARLRSALLILHIIYHQCVCALHASVVPLFSLRPSTSGQLANLYSQRLSAQMAYEHAGHIATLAHQVLARHPDDAFRWSGFVGFALYCACAIQLPFLWSVEPETVERVRAHIRANLETMAKIGRNWRYVLNLAVHVRRLYRYHSTDAVALPASIHEFSEGHLAGKYGQREAGGHDYEVWDYERTLARSETMHPDPTPSEHVLEECKELIEQASLSLCSPQTTEATQETEGSPRQDVSGLAPETYFGVRATAATTVLHTTVAPTTGWPHLASPPPSLFSEMNLYDIGENEQLLFVQAMDDMQQGDGDECDTLEDWLRR